MRPDVALISPYPPAGERHGGHSGVASYSANLAHSLADAGLGVHVVAQTLPDDPPRFQDGAVTVTRDFALGARALPDAIRAACALRPKVIHLQFELFLYGGPPALAGLLPALAMSRRPNCPPLVTTMHQVVDPGSVDRGYTTLHRVSVPPVVARNGINAVQTVISRGGARTIVHEEPFRKILPSATVIPHGIEHAVTPDRAVARRQLGVGAEFTVLCFGFLAPYKGLELVLDAATMLGPSVSVVVAGGEHPRMQGSGGYGDQLRERYADVVRFTGWVPDQDVAPWFAAADLAIFPYPKPFSASGVLALALAHGTPVLLSPALARCAGAPSLLAAPMNPRELAERLSELADDPDQVDELRTWTSVLADGRFWPAVARRHREVYQEVGHG